MRESGDTSHCGRITKEGDQKMRRLLVQAAHALMLTRSDCALKRWANELRTRRGNGKASVASARKLAVLMHRSWVTEEDFEPVHQQLAA
jgi:transposase